MSVIIKSGDSADVLAVDAYSQAKVVTSNVAAETGSFRIKSENDTGSVSGTPLLLSPETSTDYRLRVGIDSVFDDEQFNYVAQNTSKHRLTATTMTGNYSGGSFNTNNSSTLTAATGVQLSTYRYFPIIGGAATYAEQDVAFTQASCPTNTNIDFGLMTLAAAATSVPTDGVYFRWNSSGLFGVMNVNGAETTTAAFSTFIPTINVFYRMVIVVGNGEVEYWINDVLYGSLLKPTGSPSTKYAQTLPWGVRHHNTGIPSSVVQLKVGNYSVSVADYATNRLWASSQSGMGLSGIQGASGMTQGQTASYANSAAPASATLSNTAAGYTTLGGQFQFAAVAGAETDYALFAYQNTTPTTSISGRNLVIRGVWINSFNMGAAVATTSTLLQWSIAVGSTAVSLATAEAATTRAPRRLPLGAQSFLVGAAIGATASVDIDVNLDAPLVVEPSTFVHIILKMPVGTATASQIIRGVVGFNAYWE